MEPDKQDRPVLVVIAGVPVDAAPMETIRRLVPNREVVIVDPEKVRYTQNVAVIEDDPMRRITKAMASAMKMPALSEPKEPPTHHQSKATKAEWRRCIKGVIR